MCKVVNSVRESRRITDGVWPAFAALSLLNMMNLFLCSLCAIHTYIHTYIRVRIYINLATWNTYTGEASCLLSQWHIQDGRYGLALADSSLPRSSCKDTGRVHTHLGLEYPPAFTKRRNSPLVTLYLEALNGCTDRGRVPYSESHPKEG